jgi:hypothetical protein
VRGIRISIRSTISNVLVGFPGVVFWTISGPRDVPKVFSVLSLVVEYLFDVVQLFLLVCLGWLGRREQRSSAAEGLESVGGEHRVDTLILGKLQSAVPGVGVDIGNLVWSFPNCRKLFNFTLFSGELFIES